MTNVLEGQGVGWLKITRVKKLMEDENYRNFVVSRLNTALDKKLTDEDVHLDDVVSELSRFEHFWCLFVVIFNILKIGDFSFCFVFCYQSIYMNFKCFYFHYSISNKHLFTVLFLSSVSF